MQKKLDHCAEYKMTQLLQKTAWQFLKKPKHATIIALLGIHHPREMKTYVHMKTYMEMFMTAFFLFLFYF